MTYELYLGYVEPVSGNGSASVDLIPRAHERAFREAFKVLLEDPEFLPDGGTLGFGLRHVYPFKDNIEHVYGLLKGSDAVVYWSARTLGFEPRLYMLYEWEPPGMDSVEGGLIECPIDFGDEVTSSPLDITKIIRREGGIVVCRDPDLYLNEHGAYDRPEKIEWVTPKTALNSQESRYLDAMGNEPGLGFAYGELCLVVRVGKASERLAYPTSAQLKRVWEKEGEMMPTAFWSRMAGY